MKHWEPEVIYHCACTAYEGLSVFSPSLVTMNTFQNTSNLLSAAVAAGSLKRFVYLSSMSRYGKQEAPFTESM
ncbi:MAG TPA: NAD-dependent epimerase/dehydratase family protein, partial [Bacteroidia bacterium]|nr:NAD-dependent epimerase/dehydratase family protein [Bacteroidia bacterium]